MDRKLLGKRINMARKDRGMTSERLSDACHTNATYLRQIEGGTKIPNLPVLVSPCEALPPCPGSCRSMPPRCGISSATFRRNIPGSRWYTADRKLCKTCKQPQKNGDGVRRLRFFMQ